MTDHRDRQGGSAAEAGGAPAGLWFDRGAGDQGERVRRNRAVRAAGSITRNPPRGASGEKRQKRNLVSAFVSVRIIQLVAVLAAIVVFYVAFRLGLVVGTRKPGVCSLPFILCASRVPRPGRT